MFMVSDAEVQSPLSLIFRLIQPISTRSPSPMILTLILILEHSFSAFRVFFSMLDNTCRLGDH